MAAKWTSNVKVYINSQLLSVDVDAIGTQFSLRGAKKSDRDRVLSWRLACWTYTVSSIAATASRLTLDFPKTTATLPLDSIERESSFDTRLQQEDYLDLWARISKTAFAISHLGKDDLLNVVAISPVHYLGGVFHNPRKRTTQCIVRCADGNSSQDCVICEHGDVTIKICC